MLGPCPLGIATELLALQRKQGSLDEAVSLTQALVRRTQSVLDPVAKLLKEIDQRGASLTQGTAAADTASLKDRKKAFEALPHAGRLFVWTIMANDSETGALQAAKSSIYFLCAASGEGMADSRK